MLQPEKHLPTTGPLSMLSPSPGIPFPPISTCPILPRIQSFVKIKFSVGGIEWFFALPIIFKIATSFLKMTKLTNKRLNDLFKVTFVKFAEKFNSGIFPPVPHIYLLKSL